VLVWKKRPVEVANLLNPAFCSILLWDSIRAFQDRNIQGMPYPLSFLVLPVVLHRTTRDALPKSIATKLHVWLQENSEIFIGFSERTRQLVPYIKEAILYGIHLEIIDINNYGNLISYKKNLKKGHFNIENEPNICRKKAEFFGRWLANSGEPSTIFTMWGIRP